MFICIIIWRRKTVSHICEKHFCLLPEVGIKAGTSPAQPLQSHFTRHTDSSSKAPCVVLRTHKNIMYWLRCHCTVYTDSHSSRLTHNSSWTPTRLLDTSSPSNYTSNYYDCRSHLPDLLLFTKTVLTAVDNNPKHTKTPEHTGHTHSVTSAHTPRCFLILLFPKKETYAFISEVQRSSCLISATLEILKHVMRQPVWQCASDVCDSDIVKEIWMDTINVALRLCACVTCVFT